MEEANLYIDQFNNWSGKNHFHKNNVRSEGKITRNYLKHKDNYACVCITENV